MASFKQGDVIRVPFPMPTARPGSIGQLWVMMIASAENRPWPGDISFGDVYSTAGLPAPSMVRSCKIATTHARFAETLGKADPAIKAKALAALRESTS